MLFRAIAILFCISGAVSAGDGGLLYHLLSDRREANLNYALLDRLRAQDRRANEQAVTDKWDGHTMLVDGKDLEPFFVEPVAGKDRVLTFCALSPGYSGEDPRSADRIDFIAHHLLVLKVDRQQRILDGFYFMREFAEPPMLRLLLRFHAQNRRLAKGLQLSPADFRQEGTGRMFFNPTGQPDNLLNFKEAF